MKALKLIILISLIFLIDFEFAIGQNNENDPENLKRLALVIGNGKYINSMELANQMVPAWHL